jgi:hypothetical protein
MVLSGGMDCHSHEPVAFPLSRGLGMAGAMMTQQPMMMGAQPMPGQPGMYGAGLPTVGQPGMPMMGQSGMNGGMAPAGTNWLMKNRGPIPFNPPAPAEAAASWANHASIANEKAQSALQDIEKIKADAFSRINSIADQAQQVMAKAEATRQNIANDFNKEALVVFNNYTVAKDAVLKMLKMAENQALAAKKASLNVYKANLKTASLGGTRKPSDSSFAEATSFPRKRVPVGDDIAPILDMIRKYMATLKSNGSILKGPSVAGDVQAITPTKTVASQGIDAPEAQPSNTPESSEKLQQASKAAENKVMDSIGNANNEADVRAFMARLSTGTLMHDTAAAVSTALKSAKDAAERVMIKEINAEKEILDLLRQAQQRSLDAANEAIRAEGIARRAADFTRSMAAKADYAQHASAQALAAQMAQAMGYPVAVKAEPSPFPPVPPVSDGTAALGGYTPLLKQADLDPVVTILMSKSLPRRDLRGFI